MGDGETNNNRVPSANSHDPRKSVVLYQENQQQ